MKWDNKPYYSLDYFFKQKFQTKIIKLTVDGGFSCPNRDGLIGTGGCIFCSGRGSGDFSPSSQLSIGAQLIESQTKISSKWANCGYMAYFQSFTNTYGPILKLRKLYYEALNFPGIKGIAIATRPDCIGEEVLCLLEKLSKKTYIWVELGFQTSNENTAFAIHRGYKNAVFEDCVNRLRSRNIDVVAHMIVGLPSETETDMLNTIRYLNQNSIQGIKLQLLHVLRDTPLAQLYEQSKFHILTKEEYISLISKMISELRQDIVIHRLTGDGPKDSLIAPLWSLDKRDVLNGIHKKLKTDKIFQGKYYLKS